MANRLKKQYAFISKSDVPVALVDMDEQDVILMSDALLSFFSSDGSSNDVLKVLKSLMSRKECAPKHWIQRISSNGIDIQYIKQKKGDIAVTATIPNNNQANILILQFSKTESAPDSSWTSENNYGNRWMALVENLPGGVVIHQNKKIIYLNTSAEDMFEVSRKDMIGKPFLQLFAKEVKEVMNDRLEQWKEKKPTELYEFSRKKKDGDVLYLGEQTVFVEIDKQTACQSIFSNLSIREKWIHEKMRAQLAEEINQILKHEIQEHKITQEELSEAKNFNQSVIESSMDMIIAENENGKISVFNKAAEKELGYSRSEVIGKKTELLFKNKAEYKRVKSLLRDKNDVAIEVHNKRKSGELFTAFLSASKLFSTTGKYLGSMGVSRDISTIKEADEKLRKSEEHYRDLFDNMSDAYLLIDPDGQLVYWNKAGLDLLGITSGNAEITNLLDCVDKADLPELKRVRQKMLQNGKTITGQEYVLNNKKGQRRYVQVNSSPIFEGKKFTGSRELLRDVSDQKKALAEAESQSAKIRSIFESSAYMIWSLDTDYRLTSFNSNFAKRYKMLSGKEPKVGHKVLGLASKQQAENKGFWTEKQEKALAGSSQNFEWQWVNDKGKKQWFEIFLNPILDDEGNVKELSGIAHSVTFKKQAEGKIKDQAAKINSIFDSTAMLIWTMDGDFRVTSYNTNFGKMLMKQFGIEIQIGKELLKSLKPFIREDLHENLMDFFRQAVNGKYIQFEGPLMKKNGQIIWMELFLNPIFKDDTTVGEVSCMAHEITDKKIIERQIRESLKEKEILLQEVHHRVKNNLQVISSILNLQSSYVRDPNTLNILRESQNRIKSMSFIHESLYQTTDFSSIDFTDYILSLSKNLVHSYSVNTSLVELETCFEKVYLNLDQAIPCGLIVNELVSNALKYAFPDNQKGVLSMEIKENDNKIELNIRDNGVGMPENFDFDKNDSLGLQLVFTLVEQLDGEVRFNSKPNKGTEYLITFDKLN